MTLLRSCRNLTERRVKRLKQRETIGFRRDVTGLCMLAALGGGDFALGQALGALGPPAATRAIVQLQGLEVPLPQVKGSAVVPLKVVEKTQVYTTTVMVNRLPKQFLIDTGASTTLLSTDIVTSLQLPGRAVPAERLSSAVAGKDCASMKATLHTLPPLNLQSLEIRGVNGLRFEKAAVPDGLAGAMGMDILQQFDLRLNPKAKTLSFSAASTLPTVSSSAAIPLQKKLGVFLAKLTLNGQGPFIVLLDTGADSTFISEAIAQRLSLSLRQPIQVLGFCGLEPAEKSQLASVQLQQHEQKNIEAVILSSPILKLLGVDGILGQNFLSKYQQHWRFTPFTFNGAKADGSLLLWPQ